MTKRYRWTGSYDGRHMINIEIAVGTCRGAHLLDHHIEAFPSGMLSDHKPAVLHLAQANGGTRDARIAVAAS